MWPITTYEVSLSHANAHVRKGLGLPRCLSNVGLYSKGVLSLPSSSPVDEYKCAKVRVAMSLTESQAHVLKEIAPTLSTERKWMPAAAEMDVWKSALHHQNIVGHVQQGRVGFALPPLYSLSNPPAHLSWLLDQPHLKADTPGNTTRWLRCLADHWSKSCQHTSPGRMQSMKLMSVRSCDIPTVPLKQKTKAGR